MLEKKQIDFLNQLKSHSYPDDPYISKAVTNIQKSRKPENYAERITIAEMVVKNCNQDTAIRPEVFTTCLLGDKLKKIPQQKIIKNFGETSFDLLQSLSNFPQDFDCEKMYQFFIEQEDDILLLYFAEATHNLKALKEDLKEDGYEWGFYEIQNQINLGVTVQDPDYRELNEEFETLSNYFINYFEDRKDHEHSAWHLDKSNLDDRLGLQ